ncbi:hypothetical protein [Pseudochrobactrum sp. HB0163]|uniref:hypothetical protein n=1 Tax=Pseudochrobactrum sp. HB0163 TaxID=3450708 RepID=UPI003F6DAB2C
MMITDRQADNLAARQEGRHIFWIACAVLAAALVAGALFAGWLNYSDTIFMTMLMDGISWCF